MVRVLPSHLALTQTSTGNRTCSYVILQQSADLTICYQNIQLQEVLEQVMITCHVFSLLTTSIQQLQEGDTKTN